MQSVHCQKGTKLSHVAWYLAGLLWAGFLLDLTSCFPGGSNDKESACNAEDPDSIPGSERSPGEGISSPLQYSCLENSMDREACWATFMGSQRVRHDWATNLLSFTSCLRLECQVIYVPSCLCLCPLCHHPCTSPVAMLVLNTWWLPTFVNCSTPMIYFCCFPSSIFLRDLLCSMLYM